MKGGRLYVPKGGLNSVFLAWRNCLARQLSLVPAKRIDPHRIPWCRNRSPNLMNLSWREIDAKMRQEGKSSWKEMVSGSEPDCWWYKHKAVDTIIR